MLSRVARAAMVTTLLVAPVAARADTSVQTRAASWLVSLQTSDGSFGEAQPADGVAETVAALIAAGVSGEPIERALASVAARGPDRARERGAYAARIVLGLHAAGRDPRSFDGTDYVAALREHMDPVTGELDDGLYAHAVAALGLAVAGPVPDEVVRYIRANECSGGGFGHARGCLSRADTDTTAMTIAALLAAGVERDDPVIERARAFLRTTRTPDGGYGLTADAPANANSTGLALSALVALGERPSLTGLLALQHRSGGFRYLREQDEPNRYATVQAIPALAGESYPIGPRAAREPVAPAPQPDGQARTPDVRPPSAVSGEPRGRVVAPAAREPDGSSVAAPRAPVAPPASRAPVALAGLGALLAAGTMHTVRARRDAAARRGAGRS